MVVKRLSKIKTKKRLNFRFGDKHKAYMRKTRDNYMNIAEGAVRAGKTVSNVFAFAMELERHEDKVHLATGSTASNARLNIGEAGGYGLEHIFKGRCRSGLYMGYECLYINTIKGEKVVVYSGAEKANNYKRIRGNSYGMWIATEINLHHKNSINEGLDRIKASTNRKVFWDLNPDNPKSEIYTEYIDKYRDLQDNGGFIAGYNFENFLIHDNVNLSDRRIEEIESEYDKGSVHYKRHILGQRVAADGLIYQHFADHTEDYRVSREDIVSLRKISIGIDLGENKSDHAFVATGIDAGPENLYILASETIDPMSIEPKELGKRFIEFYRLVERKYGHISYIYYDNATSNMPRTILADIREAGIYTVYAPSYKGKINERIRATLLLMSQGRLWYTEDAKDVVNSLSEAMWDPDSLEDKRFDSPGLTSIDALDAFEYSFTKDIPNLIDYGARR